MLISRTKKTRLPSLTFFYAICCTISTLAIFPLKTEAVQIHSFADVAESAMKGVVNIRTKTYVKRDPSLDLYQFFMDGMIPKRKGSSSLGSGLVYNKNGIIVTNYHVIQNASEIDVYFSNRSTKKTVKAKVIGVDTKTDLAILKIPPNSNLMPLNFANSDNLRIGDVVLAIGNPFGFSHTVTSGIISAKGRVIGSGPYDSYLQTDASIHPGNSGGPLLDTRGRVIGINTAVASEGGGIGFAIPSNMAAQIIKQLLKHGKVLRPWLGIVGDNIISPEEIEQGNERNIYGVIVSNLIIEGPAQKAGMVIGDLILKIDNQKVEDLYELQRKVSSYSPGEKISVSYYRRGKGFLETSVNLELTPDNSDLPKNADLL